MLNNHLLILYRQCVTISPKKCIKGLPIKNAFDGLMIQQRAHVVCHVLFQILISGQVTKSQMIAQAHHLDLLPLESFITPAVNL